MSATFICKNCNDAYILGENFGYSEDYCTPSCEISHRKKVIKGEGNYKNEIDIASILWPSKDISDEDLLNSCNYLIDDLCKNGNRSWVMHITARPKSAPDLVFSLLAYRYKKLIELSKLKQKLIQEAKIHY